MIKANKIREWTSEELKKKEQELRKEQKNLRFAQAKGELKNPLKLREVRRDIARLLTIEKERGKS